jgi:4-carboxymuconolactone decarboxylase
MTTPRLAPLTPAELSDEQRRLVDFPGGNKNIFTTFVRHPKLFEVFHRFAGRLLQRSALPEQVRETLILRTAYRCRADYEWSQHLGIARQVGVSEEVITAVGSAEPGAPGEHTALLIRAADQLATERDLDDETWAELREHYDERQIIELCMLVGNYAMIAGVLKALRVPLDEGRQAPSWR